MKAAILPCLLLACGFLRGEFVPPSEVAPVIHREQVPLDVDRMSILSRDLVKVSARAALAAEEFEEREAEFLRASAQCLILAERFDSTAGAPRRLRKDLTRGNSPHQFAAEGEDFEILPDFLRLVAINKEAGGAILQYFLDPLAVLDPDNGLLKMHEPGGESGRWDGAVASLEAFRRKPEPAEMPEAVPGNEDSEDEGMSPDSAGKVPLVARFDGTVLFPLYLAHIDRETGGTRTESLVGEMELRVRGRRDGKFEILCEGQEDHKPFRERMARVEELLKDRHDPRVVDTLQGSFRFGQKGLYAGRNGNNCCLPVALMLEAALRGDAIESDVLILGELNGRGGISAPASPWQYLEMILKGDREFSRIVASKDLMPFFRTYLTLQKESFFMKHDVFLVENFDEAYSYLATGKMPPESRDALAQMEEIRQVGKGKTVSVFVANSHVVNRLDAVRRTDPHYLSAPMLQLRGSNKQPLQLEQTVLACKIEACLIPMGKLPYERNSRDLAIPALERMHERCRDELDPLEKYVGMNDRALYDEAVSLVNRVRSLARARDRLSENEIYQGSIYYDSSFFKTFETLKTEYYDYLTKLVEITGSEPPEKPTAEKVIEDDE